MCMTVGEQRKDGAMKGYEFARWQTEHDGVAVVVRSTGRRIDGIGLPEYVCEVERCGKVREGSGEYGSFRRACVAANAQLNRWGRK